LLSNCVLAFKCQHNQAPAYLSDQLQQVSQVESRRRLIIKYLDSTIVDVRLSIDDESSL